MKLKYCPECGAELKEGAAFCNSCGAKIGEPGAGVRVRADKSGIGMKKASAGTRFGSYIIDAIIVNVIGYALIFIFIAGGAEYMVASFLTLPVSIGYFTYFFGNGQTLGMKALKIKLCGTDGTYPIGYGKGFVRVIGMAISGMAIGLGFLWIAIDENKQGWHDKIAGTYVVVDKGDF